MKIKRALNVESSAIRNAGYHVASQLLDIEFNTGKVYRYADVPLSVYNEFVHSESKGKFFITKIKGAFKVAASAARPGAS